LLDEALNLQEHLGVSDLAHYAKGVRAKRVIAACHIFVQTRSHNKNNIGGWLELFDEQIPDQIVIHIQ
jgi:hypothetical protein